MQEENVVQGHKDLTAGCLAVVEPLYLMPLASFQPLILQIFLLYQNAYENKINIKPIN